MSKCREAYEKQYGEDFNPDHSPVASVWQAAWNAATKNAVEISDRFDFCGNEILIAEAIEAAVLEAQGKQEPVAWCFVQNGFTHYTDDKRDWYDAVGVEEVTPLYAAPVVPPFEDFFPDACRLALELECLLLSCNDNAAVSKWWDSAHEALEQHRELVAAPVVQPDMVMVPREPTEAMLDAAMNRYKHVSPEAKARYTQMHRENFRCDYRAMIAAAEKEISPK